MLKAALSYLKMGFSVIPCKTDKTPIIPWMLYQSKRPTENQIIEWWTKYPDANIGIVCGEVSGVDVLDFDTDEAYNLFNNNFIPDSFLTPTVKTPKGYHVYFKHRAGLSNSVRVINGTDFKTSGGYVITPPSKGVNGKNYKWLIPPENTEIADMPSMLFDTLLQGSTNTSVYNNIYIKGGYKGGNGESTMTTKSTNVHNFLTLGSRDNDIFHIANCLTKGGCSKEITTKVLEIIAKNASPPFDENEILIKITSALNRQEAKERNLSGDVREFVMSTNGLIMSTNIHKCLHLSTRREQKTVSTILSRMCDEGLVEKTGNKHGEYRVLDQDCKPMDWVNVDDKYVDLWLPLGLDQVAGILPGNIIVVAGAKDSGKSAVCLNVAKENRHNYNVHYFNSEMGPGEFKMRASKFSDIHISQWDNVLVYERYNNFQDVIKPGEGNLNIIDFLEVPDEVWRVGGLIQKIHLKLKGAICVIALQKKRGVELGRGAEFSMEKARLYVSLDYGTAKIISCKNFRPESPIGNPRGYSCRFKLVDGCNIIKQQPGWQSPVKEEEEK